MAFMLLKVPPRREEVLKIVEKDFAIRKHIKQHRDELIFNHVFFASS